MWQCQKITQVTVFSVCSSFSTLALSLLLLFDPPMYFTYSSYPPTCQWGDYEGPQTVCVCHLVQPWWNTRSQWSEEYFCANRRAFFFPVVQISCTIVVTLPFHRRIPSLLFCCSEKVLGSPPFIPFILLEAEKHGANECSDGCNLLDVSPQCSGCIIQPVKGRESGNRVIFFWWKCELFIIFFLGYIFWSPL